ncbi:hypothetical protein POTOM_053032 [Populus tomentosa]|nr:hypothetical protein POTOM_053032 [Populus tomentosa]
MVHSLIDLVQHNFFAFWGGPELFSHAYLFSYNEEEARSWGEIQRSDSDKMPCLYISTNVNLDDVDKDPIFSEATKAVASIIGRPEHLVMVILKGTLGISFNGNKEPAAYAEIVSMGGITKQVKRNLIATLGTILEAKLSIPRARFFLKVYDTTAAGNCSKL